MSVADEFADAFKSVTKDLHTEKKRRERDARRASRVRYDNPNSDRVTLKDAVFRVMDEAVAAATGGGTYSVSARTLYYQVRPRIQPYTDAELNYAYFSQTLLTDYQQEYGPIDSLYYEARGELHEPHTGNGVLLGTREVAAYAVPKWTFDKVLYVEKQGLWPVLKEAQLAERYDMAVIAGNGYATEACRELLADIQQDVTIFVVHDADPDGYMIARTLGEETRRMPDHDVDVIDLGLTVADAIQHQLPTETFTRKRSLSWYLQAILTEQEQSWFVGRPLGYGRQHACTRVELNAFTGPDLIAYIEAGLEANDATGKVIPPENVIGDHVKVEHRTDVESTFDAMIAELIDRDAIIDSLVAETADSVTVEADEVTEALDDNPPKSWRDAVEEMVGERLDNDQLRQRIRALLAEQGIGGGS